MNLNQEQEQLVKKLLNFTKNPDQHMFLVSGSAGTGKTACVSKFAQLCKARLVFTAPTNKATKVLEMAFLQNELIPYTPETKTIFSLLGLRLEANGEIKELREKSVNADLSRYSIVVVDEASMVSSILWMHITRAQEAHNLKFIFLGDPAQLPPVGETQSKVWEIENIGELHQVMRHDNQILTLATKIRQQVNSLAPCIRLADDFDSAGGVHKVGIGLFETMIDEQIEVGNFLQKNKVKIIAWRNKTVDYFNQYARNRLFADEGEFFPSDRVILAEPALGPDGETLATTDSEGIVIERDIAPHPRHKEITCYRVVVELDDNITETFWVLHLSSQKQFMGKLAEFANAARTTPRKWKEYWKFREAFHSLRYGYAITAHRSQGSTYENAFVCTYDILANQRRNEAFRCLYVACTRAKQRLVLV